MDAGLVADASSSGMEGARRRAISGGAIRVLIVTTGCMIALMVAAVFAVQYLAVEVPFNFARRLGLETTSMARQISDDFVRVFQIRPRVVVSGSTVFDQEVERLRLVTRERNLTERHLLEHSWMQSTKRLEIEGDFVVRAGFDLAKPFVVEIQNDSVAEVRLPEPEIFSVELVDLRILRDEDGLWNRLTAKDREEAIKELQDRVRSKALTDNLLERTKDDAIERITRQLGQSAEIEFVGSEALK